MPPKSIFRQPGAQHFQLVHRSQRDPLIHDPDAPQHVLKSFTPSNVKKGKSRADLEQILSPDDVEVASRVGEASSYGVYYDDTQYDYMQHLRAVGENPESVLLVAPTPAKSKSKAKEPMVIPKESLPSTSELPLSSAYEAHASVPDSIAGFNPDMDQHLRQALEALEDDAFVDDGLEDDFFGELVGGGERDQEDEVEFEFYEDGAPQQVEEVDENTWEGRFAKFKIDQKAAPGPASDDGGDTEGGDTVGTLPALSVIGGKRRRKGTSDASGYSMSSSSMFRTEALLTLDERFDHMMETEYAEDGEQDTPSDTSDSESMPDDEDEAPELITTREDFEDMLDDFLGNYELLGRKIRPVMPGSTGAEKLNTLRTGLGPSLPRNEDEEEEEANMPWGWGKEAEEEKKERWDCETILSTYSNLENHPRVIRARDNKLVPRITVDPRTGLPYVGEAPPPKPKGRKVKVQPILEEEEEEVEDAEPRRAAIARPRDESKDDKKARKATVKAERQARRVDKKSTKEQFGAEVKQQLKGITSRE
ncbi:LTV-domain-containing protein, partial [Athelia psychrophila]